MKSRLQVESTHLAIPSHTIRLPTKIVLEIIHKHHLVMDDTTSSLQFLLRYGFLGCIGYTNDGPYCNNPISKANIREAKNILDAIRSGADTTYVERKIPELAGLCLCKRRHQDQADNFVQLWDSEDVAAPSRPRDVHLRTHARESGDIDQVFSEMDSMDAMLDDHDREIRKMARRFRETISVYEEA